MTRTIVFICISLLLHLATYAGNPADGNNWWPSQKNPRRIVTCTPVKSTDLREMNLIQSVSGLAAQALNEDRLDEGVWISYPNPNLPLYYAALIKRLKAKEAGKYNVWELVKRYRDKQVIKGYILYDCSREDNSVNLATVYAGLKGGILIDVEQENMAIALGLSKLEDVRDQLPDENKFAGVRSQLNPNLLVLANPKTSNNRDYAIAHKSMVYYGVDSLLETILQWVKPLSPVIGWNKGDEFKHIEPCTRWALINTVSDFCMNLPLLSIQTGSAPVKIKSIDPATIDWEKKGNYHAFVMSDGDNMQWTTNQFISSPDYWANPANQQLSMGFTSCLLNLSMGSRDVYDRLLRSQPAGVSMVEYGGGYYYPDLFATARPDRKELVRKYAAMVNANMKLTGTKVFAIICKNLASENAKEMYRVFIEEIEDLTGIIAVQYSPYNGGNGKIYWIKNKKGVSIPVVTARYQLWSNQKKKGSGNPADIARYINADSTGALGWTIVHAWSRFGKEANGSFTDVAKNDKKGERGVTPVKWTSELLTPSTTIVSIEELLWRIRMQHDNRETRAVLAGN
jgi:hypothetical protein